MTRATMDTSTSPTNATKLPVVCPFCSLLCSDVRVRVTKDRVTAAAGLPDYCRNAYTQASFDSSSASPTLHGQTCTMDEALRLADQRLQRAQRPLLIAGSMDINAARSALKLAHRHKAIVSHRAAGSFLRNLRVMQETGWIGATLNELTNRADLIVFVGLQLFNDYPRLAERLMQKKRLYRDCPAEIIMLGHWQQAADIPVELQAYKPQLIKLQPEQTPNFLRHLALRIQAEPSADEQDEVGVLAKRLKAAKYAAIVWCGSELPALYSDLQLHSMAHCVRSLNKKTRCVIVPVGSTDTNNTFSQACLWTYGYPGELSFQRGVVEYDPYLFNWQRVVEQAETDLIVWLSPLKPEAPPPADVDTIALVHAGLPKQPSLAVQIPTAIPGIDHHGHLHRIDNVVVMPLPHLRHNSLPAADTLINRLLTMTTEKPQ